ncbi:hypothetical protein SAMN02745866_01811 [Alteromonadaceae bacterium Bs31]|nr:hypothetical protein SAMN02745866_01811 [Alteromonadaceae bacterium Bs31]
MLTEIEWWGGVLVIWMLAFFSIIYKDFPKETRFSFGFAIICATFAFAGITLCLYFYELDSRLMRYLYMGVVVAGIVSLVLALFWPEKSSTASEGEGAGEQNEEDAGKFYNLLAEGLFYFPIVVSFGLGLFKASAFITLLTASSASIANTAPENTAALAAAVKPVQVDAEIDCTEPRPKICTREYRPVCASKHTQAQCVAEPCPETVQQTYATACTACADPEVTRYTPGKCQADIEEP